MWECPYCGLLGKELWNAWLPSSSFSTKMRTGSFYLKPSNGPLIYLLRKLPMGYLGNEGEKKQVYTFCLEKFKGREMVETELHVHASHEARYMFSCPEKTSQKLTKHVSSWRGAPRVFYPGDYNWRISWDTGPGINMVGGSHMLY